MRFPMSNENIAGHSLVDATDDEGDISNLSKKGYQLLKENKLDEAIDCFSKILSVNENNNYALVGLGDAARKQNAFRNAVQYYQRCLANHPGNNYALFGLADCYKALNQFHSAIEIWEKYLVHDEKNITVLTRVADAYRKVRNYEDSKAVYHRVLKMESKNPYAIIGLGHLHYDFKEYTEALYYWGLMFELNRENVDIRVLTSIGNCHRKLKSFSQGIDYFEMALKRENNNFYALFGLADCYRGLNKQSISLEYWNRILSLDPRNKVILTRAGDAYRTLNQLDKAVEYYQKALNIEFDIYTILGLAVVAKIQGNYDTAIESLKRLSQQDSKNHRIYLELADCLDKKGEKEAAIEVLEEYQSRCGKNPSVSEMLDKLKK